MNELEKQLDEYINQNIYNYAFMIKGQWGSGKSHFIKKVYMKKHTEKEFIYISLNGIENIDDIDIKLTETLIKEHLGKGKLQSISLRNILKDLYKQFSYTNIIGILNKEYKKIITESIIDVITDTLSKNSVVLVFDDLERCKVECDKLLAYINNYVEHQEIKTILIADESNIKKDDYKRIREKVIGNSIEYIPNIKNNIKSLLNRISNQYVKDIIYRNIDKVDDELKKQNFSNMRTVQFAIDKFVNFYNIVLKNEEYERNIELEDKIFNYLVYISILYKKSEKLYDWKDLKYGYINIDKDNTYENYRYGFKFIDDYITKGIIYEKEILFIIQDYNNKNLPKDDPYELLKDRYWELQDDMIYNLINGIYSNLEHNKYRVDNISRILALLLKVKKLGYEINIGKFIELFKSLIAKKQENDTIYVFDTFEVIHVDEEVRAKFIEESKKLKEYSIEIRFIKINNYIANGQFNKLLEDDFIKNNQNILVTNGFFNNINLNELTNSINKEDTVIEVWYFKYFCDALINNFQFNNIIEKDVQSVEILLKLIQKIDLNECGIGKRNAIECIIEDLIKMKDYKK